MSSVPARVRGLVDRALDALRGEFGADLLSVALFGSYARGDAGERSDVDLAVVLARRARDDWARLVDAIAGAEREGDPPVSPVLWYADQMPSHPWLLIDVAEDGIVLHDDGSLGREIDDVRRRLRAYGARRVRLEDGTWFWDLKPDWKAGDVVEI